MGVGNNRHTREQQRPKFSSERCKKKTKLKKENRRPPERGDEEEGRGSQGEGSQTGKAKKLSSGDARFLRHHASHLHTSNGG